MDKPKENVTYTITYEEELQNEVGMSKRDWHNTPNRATRRNNPTVSYIDKIDQKFRQKRLNKLKGESKC